MVAAAALVVGACADSDVGPATAAPADRARAELEAARARWATAGLTTYRYVFTDDCGECGPEWRAPRQVVVWDGEDLDPGDRSPSVAEVFAAIDTALAAGQSVQVEYDPVLGVPTDVAIDMELRVVDGGTHWMIEQLSPDLPGGAVTTDTVTAAWDRWRSSRPVAYSYTVGVTCDCPFEGNVRTEVEGDRVTGWHSEFDEPDDVFVTPVTIDDLFAAVLELVAAGDAGVGDDMMRIEGSARFDPDLGYPIWVGLDLTVADQVLVDAGLPDRMVLVISDLEALPSPAPGGEAHASLTEAMQLWAALGIDDYSYEVTVHDVITADWVGPYVVTVENDAVTSITIGGAPADPLGAPSLTIDDLFEIAARQDGRLDTVLYHARFGFPVLVRPDPEGATMLAAANLQPFSR